MNDVVTVPMDVYDAPQEMVVILPLGGVKKESIKLHLLGLRLQIVGERIKPLLKEALSPMQELCFRGPFTKEVDLPANCAFDRITSDLSPENILTIVIPKIINPEEIVVQIK